MEENLNWWFKVDLVNVKKYFDFIDVYEVEVVVGLSEC